MNSNISLQQRNHDFISKIFYRDKCLFFSLGISMFTCFPSSLKALEGCMAPIRACNLKQLTN